MKMGSSDELNVSTDGDNLQTNSIQYLGAAITENARSVQEIKIRLAVATSLLSNLKTIWRDKLL